MPITNSRRKQRRSLAAMAAVLPAVAGLAPVALAQSPGSAAAEVLPPVVVDAGNPARRKKPASQTDTRLSDVEPAAPKSASTGGGSAGSAAGGGAGSGAEGVDATSSAAAGDGTIAGGGGIAGASTTVITRQQIERSPHATLTDIIAREAGVQSTSLYGSANGAGTTIDLRGFGATASSNTLILVNGRRLNDWDTQGFDLSTIARDSIERIEITRGNSAAVLYGDGAVGGVVNIVTRSAAALPDQVRVEGGFGSFGTKEGSVVASVSSGAFSALVSGNMLESDGYRDNNELAQKSAVADLRWTFARGSVYLNVAADDQELRLPGARLVDPNAVPPVDQVRHDRRGTATPLDYADKQGVRGTLGLSYMLAPDIELIVDGGLRKKWQQALLFNGFSYVDSELATASLTPRVVVTRPMFGVPSRIISGVDVYDSDYQSDRSGGKGVAPVHVYDGGDRSVAAYYQQTLGVLPATDVAFGGRIQWNRIAARDTVDITAPGACFFGLCEPEGLPYDESEVDEAWHLGFEHRLVPGLTLLGRTARSFRLANIDERIGAGFPTAFDLKTQTSRDWEAGLRFEQGTFRIQSTYFDMRLENEIYFRADTFTNVNLDPTRRRGIETIASWAVSDVLRLRGNLTYTDAEFREGAFAGNAVPLVSPWTGVVGMSWDIVDKRLVFDAAVNYVGDRRMDNDFANFQPTIPWHTTVDVRLGGVLDRFHWSAAVHNLFDSDYFDYAVASAFATGRYNAYPQPGRTFMIKAGTTW